MEEQKDFKELLQLFNKHNVEYVIIGSYALAFHGCPRYTGDLDILVKPDSNNAKNIISANELPRSKLRGIKSVIPACPESPCIKDRFRTSRNDKNDENY
ncbi:hypothetical protein BMS3Bbin08_00652 [bacterium BMS3Bbin08]|nr:hypothetical protein BMS3Bbin08_00652 [bacterium BMS3Bbin08]